MVFQEFVENTICQMTSSSFELTKEILLGEKLIAFSIIKPNKAGTDALAEKVCDYFETFEIKANRTFGKQLEAYMNELDAIVAPRIGRAAQPKKGDNTPQVTPRARKYYEKYLAYKTYKEITITQLLDFTRIMMSLYTGSINHEGKQIDNFDYSTKCLDVNKMSSEINKQINQVRKEMKDINDIHAEHEFNKVLSEHTDMLDCEKKQQPYNELWETENGWC